MHFCSRPIFMKNLEKKSKKLWIFVKIYKGVWVRCKKLYSEVFEVTDFEFIIKFSRFNMADPIWRKKLEKKLWIVKVSIPEVFFDSFPPY